MKIQNMYAYSTFRSGLYLERFMFVNSKTTRRNSIHSSSLKLKSEQEGMYDPSRLTFKNLPPETLYILDGTFMVHNAFHATKKQNETNGGIIAMTKAFACFIRDVKPTYLAVAFDSPNATFRHALYEPYKAIRPPSCDVLKSQLELAQHTMEALGCHCIAMPGFEADDIMATLGRWARERGLNAVHVSVDKDMLQLIGVGSHVMDPKTSSSGDMVFLLFYLSSSGVY
eukprot:gene3977-7921_t